ncbi:RHS repeat-associated core domain-containing protein, partial [Bacteroides uniformis]
QSKSLHGSATNKLTYAYNVRGWLTGISGSKFTQNLYYNNGNGTAKYNGSISSMTWKAGNESTVRGYKFTYDGLDRMLNATYGETAGISTNANRFSENVTGYDKNGNIKTLQRYGQTAASGYGLIDNLTFTLGGNQLTRVDDAVATSAYNNGFEFKDGVKQANEYNYDSNGNLTKDLNKGITNISYNCLNLPSVVTFSDGSTITYTYAADGTKLKTVHKTGSTTTTTDYCGNVVYENGVQKLLLTDEGYVTLSDNKYHYYLKDHQGNNRVVINQSGTVEETNHYYPFGGVFASAGNVQPYKYNGKEYDGKKGLNWYDYGARMYDAALGRFMTVDPLAEKYYPMSPYGYCLNNPIKFIDADGRLPRIYIERKGFGHAFVTVGNGDNTIVYTYGRYGELGKDKSSARNTSPTGEGVLIKLTGRDAISFIQDQMLANEAVGYEFTKGSDELVSKHFDKQLDNSNKIPQKGKYAGKENAKVIDEYNLFINNCATTSIKGIQEGVKKDLDLKDSKAPASLGDRLKVMSKEDEHSIRRITYNEIKKEFNLHGAGTKW